MSDDDQAPMRYPDDPEAQAEFASAYRFFRKLFRTLDDDELRAIHHVASREKYRRKYKGSEPN